MARPMTWTEHLSSYPEPIDCPYCDGTGQIEHKLTREELSFARAQDVVCPQCNGQGLIPHEPN